MHQKITFIENIFDKSPKNYIITLNTLMTNITYILTLDEDKFFCKVLDKDDFFREKNGYELISKYYPVSKLIYTSPRVNKKGLLIFEYEKTVTNNKGLLVDLFSKKNKLNEKFINILKLYKEVFIKTLQKSDGTASDIFFKDRVISRLPKYYSDSFLDKHLEFKLNNKEIKLDLRKILKDVNKFFSGKEKRWCIISQCDPNDLNLAIKPTIFDYTAGGLVPLMAEFATLFWYQLAQGDYLSLKYNPEAFKEHKKIYHRMNSVFLKKHRISHTPSDLRIKFITEYIKLVIEPCFKKINSYEGWYDEFKNFIALKIIGVFNVAKMSKKDMMFSLGYLHLFYNTTNIHKPMDLINFIENGKK